MAHVLGSTPTTSPAIGQFLILCGSHANLLISSFFPTASVANPLITDTAETIFNIDFDFITWIAGAAVPGLVAVVILPPFFSWVCGARYDGALVKSQAAEQLDAMGPMSGKEVQLLTVLIGCLGMWMMGSTTGLPETFVALGGLVVLLFLGTLSWDDVVRNHKAWDSFFWLSGMVLMAEQLSALGLSHFIGQSCSTLLASTSLSPITSVLCLGLLYFFSMYLFSSITGHTVAIVGPFMEVGKSLKAPPYLVTALLAYFSAMSACLTNFSSGPPVMYFGHGYISQGRWFKIGFVVAGLYIFIYYTIGLAWFKLLGFF
ncbi:hypothetical protein HK104_002444 [Borealophlyctis nickersoniae]|nr:hypothetical protein HK104_002444 [Borealophlyctis nickersoniae]